MPLPTSDLAASRALRRVGATICGRYRIVRLIGVGGMGAVYAGRHRNGHPVAIKVLHERLADSPDLERQFRREAHLSNSVNHPGVVPVIDDDVSEDGYVFLVMPLLEGETLRARWERSARRLPLEDVIIVAHRTLEALAAAHAAKIVHRDVKPENIFVTNGGEIRVLDFGIARFFETNDPSSATRSGRAVGTPAFMAPEQALGRQRDIDGRTDLWGLGAMMFSLLSGRLVHEADNASEVLIFAGTRPAPPLGAHAPETPPAIQAVVDRALSFDRADRWPDAESMDRALLGAFESAFARPLSELAPSKGADHGPADDLHSAATHWPPDVFERPGDPAGHRGRATERLPFGTTRTSNPSPVLEPLAALAALPQRSTTLDPTAHSGPGRPQEATPRRGAEVGSSAKSKRRAAPARRLVRRTAIGAAVIATALYIGAVSTKYRAARATGVASLPNSSTVPPPRTYVPEAASSFNNAITAWNGAASARASASFARAIDLDPTFAAAHLRLALLDMWPTATTRTHFAEAASRKTLLNSEEQIVLDAIAPSMDLPPHLGTTAERLAQLYRTHPESILIAATLAIAQIRVADVDHAAAMLADATSGHPDAAVLWEKRGLALASLDDISGATTAFRECIRLSPIASDCYFDIIRLSQNEGQCDEAFTLARQSTMGAPQDPYLFFLLATTAYDRSRSLDAAQPAIDGLMAVATKAEGATYQSRYAVAADVLTGNFEKADADITAWQGHLTSSRDEFDHETPTRLQLEFDIETADPMRAAADSDKYLASRHAWIPDSYFDYSIIAHGAKYRAGAMSAGDFRRERDDWLARGDRREPLLWEKSLRWVLAYAQNAITREDALEALEALPRFSPLPDRFERDPYCDGPIGATLLKADKTAEAVPYLQRAAHACDALELPFVSTWAHFDLAVALEHLGRPSEACAEYQVVVSRWGAAAHRSHTASAARQAVARLRCL